MYSYINQRGSKTLFNDFPPPRVSVALSALYLLALVMFPVLELDLISTPSWLCRDSP